MSPLYIQIDVVAGQPIIWHHSEKNDYPKGAEVIPERLYALHADLLPPSL